MSTNSPDTTSDTKPLALLVDDERYLRELYTEMIACAGYRVITFATTTELQNQLYANGGQPAADILDAKLVVMDNSTGEGHLKGYQLAAQVKEKLPDTKILLCSGEISEGVFHDQAIIPNICLTIEKAAEIGIDGFIAKPTAMGVLIAKIQEVMGPLTPPNIGNPNDGIPGSNRGAVLAEQR